MTKSEKIERINQERQDAHTLLAKHSATYQAFLQMEKTAFEDGALERKYKELIALGISVAINCESCMEWHVHQALQNGATRAQVMEALDVGMEMGGGPATVSVRFALKVLEHYSGQ